MKNRLSILALASCLACPVSLFGQAGPGPDPFKPQTARNPGQPAIDPTTGLPVNNAQPASDPTIGLPANNAFAGSTATTGVSGPATVPGRPLHQAGDYVVGGGGGGFGSGGFGGFSGSIQGLRTGPQASGVSLTFFETPSPKTSDEIAEDMQTLSYLLARNLERASADDSADYKLGIPILLGGEGRSVQASYIEGFGQLFKVSVRFPVVAPSGEETSSPRPARTSEWEEARRALSGSQAPFGGPGGTWEGNHFSAAEPYDAKLVVTLKQRILESLKNASNLRHLKPDEWIVVTVVGAPSPGPMARRANRAGSSAESGSAGATEDGAFAYGSAARGGGLGEPDSARATIMTLRVRMSSAQAYASEKLSDEQFAKQAEIATYLGPVSAGNRFGGSPYYPGAAQRK